MDLISTRDAASLLEIVHNGASDVGQEPFPSSVLSALARLIPSDAFVGYNESDFDGGFRLVEEVQVVAKPAPPALEEAFRAFGWQNPLNGCLHTREERVLRLSDFVTHRQRRRLEYDAMVWRPLGIDDSLHVWLPAEQGRARSIYLERSGKNYTDREVTLLSVLRPHLARMRINAGFRRRMNGHRGLTPRETEVLGWIARGRTNAEIGRLLFISPHTVRKHVENIFEKLDVRTRTAAAACARSVPLDEVRTDASYAPV